MLSQPATTGFIGRERELALFEEWLADPAAPWILYFHDAVDDPEKKGGIGKTWLLRKCIERVQARQPEIAAIGIDFFNIDDRQGISIARHIVERLLSFIPSWHPSSSLLELFTEYEGSPGSGTELAAFLSRLSGTLTAELRALDQLLQRQGRYILIFFDTFELIEKDPFIASLELTHFFPDNYQCEHIGAVMAGRNALNWQDPNWQGREREVRSVAIAPFSEEEMLTYLRARLNDNLQVNAEEARLLYERTEGRPILIGLVADVLIYQATTLKELLDFPPGTFESQLVTKINDLANPTNWIVLFMAHTYHRFNSSLLEWILRKADLYSIVEAFSYEKTLENLLILSFIRRSSTGTDFVLHDEMRKLVIKYCWDPQDLDLTYRQQISRSTISYYEAQVQAHPDLRQTYTVEMLYHKLYVHLEEGFQELETQVTDALNNSQAPYAHALLQECDQFQQALSPGQRHRLLLLRAALLKQEEKPEAALEIYRTIETSADAVWLEHYQADLLYGLGDCMLDLNRFVEASDYLTRCLELEQARGHLETAADILGLLGYMNRREGNQEQAVRYYQQSLQHWMSVGNLKEYANILNSLGYVFRLQGKIDDALHTCKAALRMRQKLFDEGKAPPISIAFSHSTLGMVYHYNKEYNEAEGHFKQAFDIYRRAGNNHYTMLMYSRFGQVEMSRGNLEQARAWFLKVEESLIGTDLEVQTINLIRQGLLDIITGLYHDAIDHFARAHETATRMRDNFQIAESLIRRAEAMMLAGEAEASKPFLEQGLAVAQNHQYYVLLGRAYFLLGTYSLNAGDYTTAFTYFAQSCHQSALYNGIRFASVHHDVYSILLNSIPLEELPHAVAVLLDYWHTHQLEAAYPEIPAMCESLKVFPYFPLPPHSQE